MLTSSVITIAALAVLGTVGIVMQPAEPQNTQTTTYYVSPKGDDTNAGTSQQQSLATIQKALDVADAGDVIQLADGQYQQGFKSVRAGAKTAPITIKGSRNAVVTGANDGRVVEIRHSYLTLEGFHINGQSGDGTKKEDFKDKLIYVIGSQPKAGVEGLKIKEMLIENAGGECVRLRYFARHNEISGNVIKNCGRHDFVFNGGGKNGEGIYIGTAPEQLKDGKNPTADPDESKENWVHHNTIETNGNECVDVKETSSKNLIEYNHCSNQSDPNSGGLDARGNNNTFRNNIVENSRGAGVRLGGDKETDGTGNEVYNNTFVNNAGGAFKILRQPQGTICGNEVTGTLSTKDLDFDPTARCE